MKSVATVDELKRKTASGGFGLTALWTLYTLTIRQHLHGRRWMVMTAGCLLAVGLAILIRATAPKAPGPAIEFVLAYLLIPQALLPLIALVYASGIIHDEQEEQTLTYLLVRPIPRWAIYVIKLLATMTTTVVLTAAFTALMYAAIYVGANTGGTNIPLRCAKTAGVHCLAVLCYCCLFGMMSLLTKWSLIVGVMYAAVVEGVLANLPFGIRLITIVYYTRLIAYRSMSFVVEQPGGGGSVDIAAEAWQYDPVDIPNLENHPSAQTCILILAAASLVCTVVSAVICTRREFYVKTPEGT